MSAGFASPTFLADAASITTTLVGFFAAQALVSHYGSVGLDRLIAFSQSRTYPLPNMPRHDGLFTATTHNADGGYRVQPNDLDAWLAAQPDGDPWRSDYGVVGYGVSTPPNDPLTTLGIGPEIQERPYCDIWIITRERDESLLFGADRRPSLIDMAFTLQGARDRMIAISGLGHNLIEHLELRSPNMGLEELVELVQVTTGDRFEILPYETLIRRQDLSFLH